MAKKKIDTHAVGVNLMHLGQGITTMKQLARETHGGGVTPAQLSLAVEYMAGGLLQHVDAGLKAIGDEEQYSQAE